MIELRLIRHALVLGKHRSFARAAAALNLTQPSLSRSIAALERALGVPLFDRTRNGVVPTAFGEMLLERGAGVLKSESDLRREIQLLAGLDAGALAVGTGPYPLEPCVVTAVARLLRAHPRLNIRLVSLDAVDVVREVLAEKLDVGVSGVSHLGDDPRLVIERFGPQRLYLACRPGHPLLAERGVDFSRALQYPLAAPLLRGFHAAAFAAPSRAAKLARDASFTAMPQIQINTTSISKRLALESDVLFPACGAMLADDVAAGRLAVLDVHVPALRTEGGILYLRERTMSPATRAFLAALREAVAADQRANAEFDRLQDAKRARSDERRGAGRARRPRARLAR